MDTQKLITGVVAAVVLTGIGGYAYTQFTKPPSGRDTKGSYFNPNTGGWEQKTPKETAADKKNWRRSNLSLSKQLLPLTQDLDVKHRAPGGFFGTLFSAGLNVAFSGPLAKTYNARHFIIWALNTKNTVPSDGAGARKILTKYKFKKIPNGPKATVQMLNDVVRLARNSVPASKYYSFITTIPPEHIEDLDEDGPDNA